jgi:hypothetical protein
MKRTKIASVALVLAASILLTSCYGSFKLTRNLHEWNGTLGDKWINALVFYGLLVVPVYEIAVTVDAVILNTIEFWTGDNPVAMKDGRQTEKIVKNEKGTYKITAQKNRIIIEGIDGPEKGKTVRLRINEQNRALYLEKENQLVKIAEYDQDQQLVSVFKNDGTVHNYKINQDLPLAMTH